MIDQFLDKITGVFRRDFLFASLLPVVFALVVCCATLTLILGLDPVWSWVVDLDELQAATYSSVATLLVIVLAYLIHGLRVPMRRLWSGELHLVVLWPLVQVAIAYQRARRRCLKERTLSQEVWGRILEDHRSRWKLAREGRRWRDVTVLDLDTLQRRISRLQRHDGVEEVRCRLLELSEARLHGGPSTALDRIHAQAVEKLDEWISEAEAARRTALFDLGQRYPRPVGLLPTDLGNVIDGYDHYSYSRYRMESALFWPRLFQFVSTDLRSQIEDRTILLDFALTTATLAAVYGLAACLLAPLLHAGPVLWAIALSSLVVSYLFYRLGVSAAGQLGHYVRTAFDVHRLELLKAYGLPQPTSYRAELAAWAKISQLVVYGDDHTGHTIEFPIEATAK